MDEFFIDQNKSDKIRGFLLSAFALLEKRVEGMIAFHFTKDKERAYQLGSIILDRMTFESKRTSLKFIYEIKCEQQGFVKTKNNTYPTSYIFNEMRKINEVRNYFAHYLSERDTKPNKDIVIGLTSFRDKGDTHWFTMKEVREIQRRMAVVTNILITIENQLDSEST